MFTKHPLHVYKMLLNSKGFFKVLREGAFLCGQREPNVYGTFGSGPPNTLATTLHKR